MPTIKFTITNLTCPACVVLSIQALKEIAGVAQANVDLKSGAATVQAEREIDWGEITSALRTVGKTAELQPLT